MSALSPNDPRLVAGAALAKLSGVRKASVVREDGGLFRIELRASREIGREEVDRCLVEALGCRAFVVGYVTRLRPTDPAERGLVVRFEIRKDVAEAAPAAEGGGPRLHGAEA